MPTEAGGLDHQFQWDATTDTYSGPGALADVSPQTYKMRRVVRRTPTMVEKSEPVRFLTSRGDEITAYTVPGHELEIREGSVIDAGFENEAVVLKRLA